MSAVVGRADVLGLARGDGARVPEPPPTFATIAGKYCWMKDSLCTHEVISFFCLCLGISAALLGSPAGAVTYV